jgi:hypothetical protein
MNEAQEKVIAEVRKILGDNFNAYLLTVCDVDENLTEQNDTYWKGGRAIVSGLAVISQARVVPWAAASQTE